MHEIRYDRIPLSRFQLSSTWEWLFTSRCRVPIGLRCGVILVNRPMRLSGKLWRNTSNCNQRDIECRLAPMAIAINVLASVRGLKIKYRTRAIKNIGNRRRRYPRIRTFSKLRKRWNLRKIYISKLRKWWRSRENIRFEITKIGKFMEMYIFQLQRFYELNEIVIYEGLASNVTHSCVLSFSIRRTIFRVQIFVRIYCSSAMFLHQFRRLQCFL